jgi:deoxyribonuclease V
VRVRHLHPFDLPPKDAIHLQAWLASKVDARGSLRRGARLVAGLDCSIDRDGHVHGAVVVCKAPDWSVVESVTASAPAPMPYVPGLLSFRETPILLDALRRLRTKPDVLVVDGHGLAHPRGLGIASHVGLHVDVPVVGVAKKPLLPDPPPAGRKRGDWRVVEWDGRTVGLVLTTKDRTSPVYVSVGNRIGLMPAARLVLRLATKHRLPEPIRAADAVSREAARALA